MVVEPTLDLLNKAQRASVSLAVDTFSAVVSATKTGLTQPEELVGQIAGFVGAAGDMAGYAAQPLQNFIVRQQELADAMATLAELHVQLAEVVATVARHHKGVVDSLEALSSPLLTFAIKTEDLVAEPVPSKPAPRSRAKTPGKAAAEPADQPASKTAPKASKAEKPAKAPKVAAKPAVRASAARPAGRSRGTTTDPEA